MIIDACTPFRCREQLDSMFKMCDMDEDLRLRTVEKSQGVPGSLMTIGEAGR